MSNLSASPADVAAIEREIRAKARRRVRAKVGLMWHFVIFAMANLAIYEINQRFSPGYQWFVWPLCAWSIGIALHAFAALSGGGMTEDMLRVEIEKEKRRRGMA
jgi:hypothetical protein